MKITDSLIPDVKILEPKLFHDNRGFFFESFNHKVFRDAIGRDVAFVQDNHSKSLRHVLRGLHYQVPPFAQGKLIRVIQGKVFDVAVDIRRNSITFGKWIGTILSAENMRQLWIPEGFAHGFLTLSDTAELLYKTTNYYAPAAERCIIWSDPSLSIDWHGVQVPVLSEKDTQGCLLDQAEVFDE